MNLIELENTIREQIKGGSKEISLQVPLGEKTLQVSGKIEPGQSILTLAGDFETGQGPQAADLVDFFGLEAFVQSFPEPLRALQNIEYSQLKLGVELEEPPCLSSIFILANLPELEGFPAALRITGGAMETTVDRPLEGGARQVSCSIHGNLMAGEKAIDARIDLPQGKITGSLAEGEQIDATALIYPILDAVDIPRPQGFLSLQVQKVRIEGDWKTRSLSFSADSQDTWNTDLAGKDFVFGIEHVEFDYAGEREGKFQGKLSGKATFAGAPVEASVDLAKEAEIDVNIPCLNLTAILQELLPGSVSLPEDLPELEFTEVELKITPQSGEFKLKGSSDGPWAIPVGVYEPSLHDIHLEISRQEGENGQNKKVAGVLEGKWTVGTAEFATQYTLPGEIELKGAIPSIKFSPLVQELCGASAVQNLGVPVSLLDAELQDLAFTIAPQSKTFSVSGAYGSWKTELIVKRIEGKWAFVAGFLPPAQWKLSDLVSELSALDDLAFSNTALVVSTARDSDLKLETITLPRSDLAVVKGLNFLACLETTGKGIDQLLGLHSIDVYAAIGSQPADTVLEAIIDGEFQLDRGVVFTGLKMRLQPSPFSLSLLGTIIANLNGSQLNFVGGMQIDPNSAKFQTTVRGIWNEPFGIKALVVSDLALELGLTWPPPLPAVSFAGGLKVGDFTGALAVKFDATDPSHSMLAVAFNRLYLMDIIRTFLSPEIVRAIPEAVQSSVLNVGMEDVNVYIVPQTTRIGELIFEKGFTVHAGKVVLWGMSGAIHISLDYEGGLVANGSIDPIRLAGGLFELTGAAGQPKAAFALEVAPNKVPVIDLTARVVILGAQGEAIVKLSQEGFYFLTSLKLFDVFQASLEAWGRDFNQGGDFHVKATMQNDLLAYLCKNATDAIEAGTRAAVAGLNDAYNAVRGAQIEVEKLDSTINDMRRTVEAERDAAKAELRREQQRVTDAQREVDRLGGLIQGAYNEINATQKEIDAKKRWYDRLPWYRQSYEWIWLGPYLGGLYAKISGLYASIGTLEAARWTANGVLEGYKQVVNVLESEILNWTPIEMDPRLAGLYAARYTAWGALEAAEGVLIGLKETMGFLGGAAIYIIQNGLANILNVQAATFEAALSYASGGNVSLGVSLIFMGQPRYLNFNFNFQSPLESAKSLGHLLLAG